MSRPDTTVSLSGGGAAAKAAQVFRRMDNDNNGGLDFGEMLQALRELGVLDGIQAAEATRVLQKEVKEADTDHNGLIDFREFQHYFQRMALYQQNESRKQKIKRKLVPAGAERNPVLKSCFREYCQQGKTHLIGAGSMSNVSLESLRMNSRQFGKFCKELGIIQPNGEIEPMTIDVIFAQCKLIGDRSISFKGFLEALSMLADDCGLSFDDITSLISQQASGIPVEKSQSLQGTIKKPSTPRPQTASLVAQSWKRPLHSALSSSSKSTNGTVEKSFGDSDDSRQSSKELHKLLEQAREEGRRQAAEEWEDEKLHMEDHIHQLQDMLASLQGEFDTPDKAAPVKEKSPEEKKHADKQMKKEMERLKANLMEDMQHRIDSLGAQMQGQHQGKEHPVDDSAVNKLRLQVVQLEDVVSRLQETQSVFNSTGTGSLGMSIETAPAADFEEAIQALEERALDRQSRLEAALLQIASKVDLLEERMNSADGQ